MAPTMAVRSSTKLFSRLCMRLKARAARPTSAGPSRPRTTAEGSRPSSSAASTKPDSGLTMRRANSQPNGAVRAKETANQISTRRCQLLGNGSGAGWTMDHWPFGIRQAATKSPSTKGASARPNRPRWGVRTGVTGAALRSAWAGGAAGFRTWAGAAALGFTIGTGTGASTISGLAEAGGPIVSGASRAGGPARVSLPRSPRDGPNKEPVPAPRPGDSIAQGTVPLPNDGRLKEPLGASVPVEDSVPPGVSGPTVVTGPPGVIGPIGVSVAPPE